MTQVDFPLIQIRKEIGEFLLAESTTEFWFGFSYFHLIMEEKSWLNQEINERDFLIVISLIHGMLKGKGCHLQLLPSL